MANRKHYEDGIRNRLLRTALSTGCLPHNAISLLGLRTESVQKKAREMIKEGMFREYKEKGRKGKERIWAYVPVLEHLNEYRTDINEEVVVCYESIVNGDSYRVTSTGEYSDKLKVIQNAKSYMFCEGVGISGMNGRAKDLETDTATCDTYYTSREVKGIVSDQLKADLDRNKKLNTTRMNGLVRTGGVGYILYNVGRSVSHYSLTGEFKMLTFVNNIFSKRGERTISEAIMLADNMNTYARFINCTRKEQVGLGGLEGTYDSIYALTCNAEGQKFLRLMKDTDWKERIYSNVLTLEQRQFPKGSVECDGRDEDKYYFVFCVPDIKRLKLFLRRAEIENNRDRYTIYCFDTQKELVMSVAGRYARVYSTRLEDFCE